MGIHYYLISKGSGHYVELGKLLIDEELGFQGLPLEKSPDEFEWIPCGRGIERFIADESLEGNRVFEVVPDADMKIDADNYHDDQKNLTQKYANAASRTPSGSRSRTTTASASPTASSTAHRSGS